MKPLGNTQEGLLWKKAAFAAAHAGMYAQLSIWKLRPACQWPSGTDAVAALFECVAGGEFSLFALKFVFWQ